jgi:hypothetical protein
LKLTGSGTAVGGTAVGGTSVAAAAGALVAAGCASCVGLAAAGAGWGAQLTIIEKIIIEARTEDKSFFILFSPFHFDY